MNTATTRNWLETLEVVAGCLVCLAVLAVLGGGAGWVGYWVAEWWGVVVAELLLLVLGVFGFFWLGWAADLPGQATGEPKELELDSTWGTRPRPTGGAGALDAQRRSQGAWAWHWKVGRPRLEVHFADGTLHGPYRSWFDNGQLEYEGTFQHGQRIGPWTQWHRNGQKAAERSFVADRAEGESNAWWETGERRWQLHFHQGQEHGLATFWLRGGLCKRKGQFEKGLRCGQWQEWHDNGLLARVESFAAGKPEGQSGEWNRDGQLVEMAHWREGVRDGESGTWYANGQPQSWGAYHNDARQGDWRQWHEDGTPRSLESYERGALHGEATYWYDDGQLHEQCHWRTGQRHGGYTRWHVNGERAAVGEYRKEKPHGVWLTCDEAGRPVSEIHYRLGQLHGPWRRWYPDGQQWVEAAYHRGMLHGEWAQWRPDGSLWSCLHFVYGVPLERGVLRFRDPQELDIPPTNRWFLLFWLVLAAVGAVTVWKEVALGVGLLAVLLAIMIHEWGHYLAAWLVGIPIRTFRVGAGPVLLQVRLGNTTFELSLLPFWGYVLPYTLRESQRAYYYSARRAFRRDHSLQLEPPGGTISRKTAAEGVSPMRRLVFLMGGVLFNLATAGALLYSSTFLAKPPPTELETLSAESAHLHGEVGTLLHETSSVEIELFRLEIEKKRLLDDRARLAWRHETLARDIRWMNDRGLSEAEYGRRRHHVHRLLRQSQREEDAWQKRWAEHLRHEQERSRLVEQKAELARKGTELHQRLERVKQQLDEYPEPPPRDGLEGIGRSLLDESPRGALQNYALFNIVLAVFNLFPMPPLDGYHILAVLLSVTFRRRLSQRTRNVVNLFGCLVMLLLLLVSVYFMVSEVLGILFRSAPEP